MIDYWLHHTGPAHLSANLVCTVLTIVGLRKYGVPYLRIAVIAAAGIAIGGLAHALLIETPIVGASGAWCALLGYLLWMRLGILAFAGIAVILAGHAVFDSYLGLTVHGVAYLVGTLCGAVTRAQSAWSTATNSAGTGTRP